MSTQECFLDPCIGLSWKYVVAMETCKIRHLMVKHCTSKSQFYNKKNNHANSYEYSYKSSVTFISTTARKVQISKIVKM